MNNLSILASLYQRLQSIERYSTTPKVTHENVAAHSYCVSLLSMYFSSKDKTLNSDRMLKMSLLHDCDETIGGDITMNMKRLNPKARTILEDISSEVMNVIFSNLDSKDDYLALWQEYKERTSREARLVKVADIVSKVFLMKTEYEMGNKFAIPILSTIKTELIELEAPMWVITEVCEILDDLGIQHKTFEEI